MRQLATRDLSGNDTLVTWAPDPVLFHTATYASGVLRAGLLRGDRMVGTAEVRWDANSPRAFEAVWTSPDSPSKTVRGTRAGAEIRISGSRDTTLAVPGLPWAVADYGMESLLTPLLGAHPATRGTWRAVILRPYGLKWDTLEVQTERTAAALVVRTGAAGSPREVYVVSGRRLLWLRQPATKAERRPLEGSSSFDEYTRLRTAVGDVR
jgi:hypothetical protein